MLSLLIIMCSWLVLLNDSSDKFASTASASKISLGRTWMENHRKATTAQKSHHEVPSFPLSLESLASIAALMMLDDFRAFKHYLSWAKKKRALGSKKGEHFRPGGNGNKETSQSWARCLFFSILSCSRNLCLAFHVLSRTCTLEPHLVILCSLMREIEAEWACVGNITFDHNDRRVPTSLNSIVRDAQRQLQRKGEVTTSNSSCARDEAAHRLSG